MTSLEGIPVKFIDTAGIRKGADRVEAMGVERSYRAMADADLSLVVIDLSVSIEARDTGLIEHAKQQGRYLLVGNKCDLPRRAECDEELIAVSALTGEGIEELRRRCLQQIAPGDRMEQEGGFITSIRHEQRLRESLEAIEKAREATGNGLPHEMLLIDLYTALQSIDAVTGATTADDILNRIFSTFCIGK